MMIWLIHRQMMANGSNSINRKFSITMMLYNFLKYSYLKVIFFISNFTYIFHNHRVQMKSWGAFGER